MLRRVLPLRSVLISVLAVLVALVMLAPGGRPASAACRPVTEHLTDYVEYACYGGTGPQDGVELKLTDTGLSYCRTGGGALSLAIWVMNSEAWIGSRSLASVTVEINLHCWAALIPFLLPSANPINITFF